MNDADLVSISQAMGAQIAPLSRQLNERLDRQDGKLDLQSKAVAEVADRQMATDKKLDKIAGWLEGPDGLLVKAARVQQHAENLQKAHDECEALQAYKAEQTGQWQAQGAKRVKSDPPRSDLAVQREKTRRERIKLAAIVIGIVAGSGAGGAGLLQLLSPAQASQPAAAQTP